MDQDRNGVGSAGQPALAAHLSATAPPAAARIQRIADLVIGTATPGLDGLDAATATAVARRLGEMWLDDSCSFCDVTLGVHRLMRHHAALSPEPAGADSATRGPGTILLSPVPGDQHGFGSALVARALVRAGWKVMADVPVAADALLAAAKRDAFDVIGLSVGHERALEPTGKLVAALRRVSRNRGVRIALGGPALNGRAAVAHALGADVHADEAEALVSALAERTALAA